MGCWPLFIAFTVVPVAEIWLLLQVGNYMGAGWTILLVLATGALGAALARSQGLLVWREVQLRLQAGAMPGREMVHGLLLLVGGLVLLTPGFLTDAAGLALLLPAVREPLITYFLARLKRSMERGQVKVWYWQRWEPPGGRNLGIKSRIPRVDLVTEWEQLV